MKNDQSTSSRLPVSLTGIPEATPFTSTLSPCSGPFQKCGRFVQYVDSLDWTSGKTKHTQTFHSFLRAASLGVDPDAAYHRVIAKIRTSGGMLAPKQVHRQMGRAYEYVTGKKLGGGQVGQFSEVQGRRKSKAQFSPDCLGAVANSVAIGDPGGLLRSRSVLPPHTVSSQLFLQLLFRPGEKVLVFDDQKSQGQVVEIGAADEVSLPVRGDDGIWFLTNPVDGQFHWNEREGKTSRRSAESVTAWRHLLIEADEADTVQWMTLLVLIPLPIVAIYSSGGRSIHALVRIDASSKNHWDEIRAQLKPTLVTLGADPNALTAVRLSRLPQCWRGESLQQLIYVNPFADGTPIINQPTRHFSTGEVLSRLAAERRPQ